DPQKHGDVGPDSARRQVADLLHPLGTEAPRHALVGDTRVAEAVADDVGAGLPGRGDHLLHQLRPSGAEQQELGQRIEPKLRILQQLADPLTRWGAAGLAHKRRLRAERRREQLRLSRLPRAVDPLERDEHTPRLTGRAVASVCPLSPSGTLESRCAGKSGRRRVGLPVKSTQTDRTPSRPQGLRLMFATLWTRLAGPYLDQELAEGANPPRNLELSVRAHQITTPKARQTVARALRAAVSQMSRPPAAINPTVPMDQLAIRSCREELRKLADRIVSMKDPCARGVAIARQLAFDGRSPLFWKPNQNGPGLHGEGAQKLANTIHAAQAALGVAADFDQ